MDTIKSPVADDGSPYAHLTINTNGGGRPGDVAIRLSTGHQLGCVQSVSWTAKVNDGCRCVVETILTPAELKILLTDTTLKIELGRNPLSFIWTYYTEQFRWRVWYRLFPKAKAKAVNRILTGKD